MSSRISRWLKKEIKLPLRPLQKRPPPLWAKRLSKALAVLYFVLLAYFAFWRITLFHEINQRFAIIRKAGLPISGQELNLWRPEIRDSENAALVLTQAFALLRTFPAKEQNKIVESASLDRRMPWNSEIHKTVAEYVEMNTNALARTREAAQRPHARFDTDLSYGPDSNLSHLGKLKTLSVLTSLKAILDAEDDHTNEWVEDIGLELKVGSTLDEEPILLSYLVRNGIIRMAVKTTERCLNETNPGDTACNRLSKFFLNMEKTNVFPSALMGDRAMTIPVFRLSWAEIQRASKTDENGVVTAQPQRYSGKVNPLLWLSGFFERDLNIYLQVMETNIHLATVPPPQSFAATNFVAILGKRRAARTYPMAGLMLPSLAKIFLNDAAVHAQMRLVNTALAIERFRILRGSSPTDLKQLVPQFLDSVPTDPFDGAPLRYRLLNPGYVIYSIGIDGHDDGGRETPAEGKKSSDQNSYDITFTVDR
jgi:hypothetical protein